MKSIVTINGRDLVPHKIIDGKHVVSKTPFFIRTYDDAGNLVDESSVPFGPELFNLLKKRLPAEAARRGEDLTFSGRVTKKKANGLGDTELDEDEALANLMQLYDSRARRWAFDPDYLNTPEAPKQLMDDWFSMLHKLGSAPGSTSITSNDPNLEVLANEIVGGINSAQTALPDWLQPAQHDEEQQQRRNYMQLMAAMSEAAEPGYIQKMIDSFRQSENAGLRDKLAPALDELLGGIAHNRRDKSDFPGWTRDQEMARRHEMVREYGDWLQSIAGNVSEDEMQALAKQVSAPKSKLLTNILNGPMDFNPLFGNKLEFVDPDPDPEYGPRITDIWAPKARGLWSPKRRFIPYFETGNYPVYNFNADLWTKPNFISTVEATPEMLARNRKEGAGMPKLIKKEMKQAENAADNFIDQYGDVLSALNKHAERTAGLSPVEQFERMGLDPREWGTAPTYADWSGATAESSKGDILPMNYLRNTLKQKKRGYHSNIDFSAMLGEDYRTVLDRLNSEKSREKTKAVEGQQLKDMVAGKTNIGKWQLMNSKQRRQAYKQHMKNVFEQGLTAETGLDWASLMEDPDKADTVRKQYYKLRDEGTPFDEINAALSDTVRNFGVAPEPELSTEERAQARWDKEKESLKNELEYKTDSIARQKACDEEKQVQAAAQPKKRVVVVKKKRPTSPDELEGGGTVDLSDIASALSDRL